MIFSSCVSTFFFNCAAVNFVGCVSFVVAKLTTTSFYFNIKKKPFHTK
nr:MAG TPA: hypothetical protein [Bacteriophage sp.]